MAKIFYGTSRAKCGIGEALVRCPACEKDSWADIMVESIYYHIYWIPMFPIDKVVYLECNECGMKRHDIPFIAKFFYDYEEMKNKFRHPAYTYLGVGFIAFIAVCIVLARIF
jgi:hypothetical protein